MSGPHLLLDSNILIHSLNTDSFKYRQARSFLQQVAPLGCLAQQNILETYRIITHKRFPSPYSAEKALESLNQILTSLTLLIPTRKTTLICFELLNKYQITGLETCDVFLVSTMLSHGVTTLATENVQDFQIFSEIHALNPFAGLSVHEKSAPWNTKSLNPSAAISK